MTDYNLTQLKVLVVDDYQPMRIIMKNVLHALGIKDIVEASNGEDALKTLQASLIDIVFTDNLMAPMNGIELVQKIRSGENGVNAFTPVIMVSGYADLPNIIEARDAGINEFLAKPVSAKLIYLRICSVIEIPRSFVDSDEFYGPDRRRRPVGIEGGERRDDEYDYDQHKRSKSRPQE